MTGDGADGGEIDAEQASGRMPAFLEGCVEENAVVGRRGEPRVLNHLGFQLTCLPARITERHGHGLGSRAARERIENIRRRRDVNLARYLHRRVPTALGSMDHEAAILLYRPALQDGQLAERGILRGEFQFVLSF